VPKAPQSRSGRYAELDTGQVLDIVEQAYERDDLPDWELVLELSRRAAPGELSDIGTGAVGASQEA